MTGKIDQIEIITSIQRRRRCSAEEKTRIERTEFREFGDQGLSDGFSNTRHGRQQFSPSPPRRLIRACDL
jgi:hypothetical protein